MAAKKDAYKMDKIISKVLEAHGLLPEGEFLSSVKAALCLYKKEFRKEQIESDSDSERERILLSRIEDILLTEGLLPSSQEKKFS